MMHVAFVGFKLDIRALHSTGVSLTMVIDSRAKVDEVSARSFVSMRLFFRPGSSVATGIFYFA